MLAKTPPLSFSQRVLQLLLYRVQYRRVETRNELNAILRLRYDAYLREGAISPSNSRRLEDDFDQGDNVYNLGVFIDGELAGALRIHVLTRVGQKSPGLETFGEFLVPELSGGKVIIDPNRFVANYSLARRHPELPYITVRAGFLAAVHFDADLMTMTVRREHQAFYRRNFLAYMVCPPRPYPLLNKPISLLFMDFIKAKRRVLQQHPYWVSSELERQSLFGKFGRCHGETIAA